MSPSYAVISFVVPALISLAILLAARRPWAGPVALAAGFCGIMPWIVGRTPQLWPAVSPDCIFYIAIFVALFGLADLWFGPTRWLRMFLTLGVFAAVFAWLLVRRMLEPTTQGEAFRWLAIAPPVTFGAWFIFDQESDRSARWASPLAMLTLTAFTSVVLGMSGSFDYGRIGLALAGAMGPLVLVAGWTQRYAKAASAVALLGVLAPLLIAGRVFLELSILCLSLIAFAPVGYLIGQTALPRRWPPAMRGSISLSLLALPLVAAVLILLPGFLQVVRETTEDYRY